MPRLAAYRPKSRAAIARNMSAIRSAENRTETALRKALFRAGLRYRKYRSELPGRPDITFVREKVAVFVDGDYWHGRLLVERGPRALRRRLARLSKQSRAYWLTKFQNRVLRDRAVTSALTEDGWIVLRFWESEARSNIARIVRHTAAVVRRRRKTSALGAKIREPV